MVPHKHHTFSHAMNWCRSSCINSNIYITHTSPTSPKNIRTRRRCRLFLFETVVNTFGVVFLVAGWLMVPSWTRLTSVDFDLQGSVPKETKSWPQSKWNSKSFVLSLEPLDIFGSFTDVSICFYSSLSISLEPLEFQKQKKSAREECSRIHPEVVLHCSCKSLACIWLSTHSLT